MTMKSSTSVLVTGGAGFIGSHLCEELLRRGRRVLILDNFNDFYDPVIKKANLSDVFCTAKTQGGELVLFKGDLRSPGDCQRAVAALGDPADAAVIHLAAMAGVRPSLENPRLYYDVNVTGTLNLMEACRERGVKKVLFASSSSVYGNNEKVPFLESDPVDNPISPYAATKKMGELLCYNYHHLYDFSVACLRFFTVYGPRQRPDLAIHKFAFLLKSGKEIPFFGDGTTRRDYTYVTDTLQGILGALAWVEGADVPCYDIFNLGESRTVDLSTLVRLIGGAMGVEPVLNRFPMQPGDVLCTYADISKAKEKLGYAPHIAIEEGITLFMEWFLKNEGKSKNSH